MLANQGAAVDSTTVLDSGVASPLFPEAFLSLDTTALEVGGQPLFLHPLLLDGYGYVLVLLQELDQSDTSVLQLLDGDIKNRFELSERSDLSALLHGPGCEDVVVVDPYGVVRCDVHGVALLGGVVHGVAPPDGVLHGIAHLVGVVHGVGGGELLGNLLDVNELFGHLLDINELLGLLLDINELVGHLINELLGYLLTDIITK